MTVLSLAVALISTGASAQRPATTAVPTPTAEEIMARVAANQDKAETERSHYIYVQHAHVTSRKGKTPMCEEETDSRVTPSATGSQAALLRLQGRALVKHRYITYTAPLPDKDKATDDHDSISVTVGDDTTDRDIVQHMRVNLTNDDSKDGIAARLFPLTSKDQQGYSFRWIGRERMNGRDVFHVEFAPKDKSDFSWKGDAWVDTDAYQPVVVSTELSRKIPLAVRMLLGTNVPGLGFTVVYAPQPDGIWFPVNLSSEFKIHVLFFFTRDIIIDAQNRSFEKTHVTSTVVGAAQPPQP